MGFRFRSMALVLDGLVVVCALYVLLREVVSVQAVAFAGRLELWDGSSALVQSNCMPRGR